MGGSRQKEVDTYIERQLQAGHSPEAIIAALHRKGHKHAARQVHRVWRRIQHKRVRISFFVVGALLLVLVLLLALLSNKESPVQEERTDQEIFQDALASGDASACTGIEDERLRSECLYLFNPEIEHEPVDAQEIADRERFQQVLVTGNQTLCEEITTPSLVAECNHLFSNTSNKTVVKENRDMAQFLEAIQTGDATHCHQIKDQDLRNECLYIMG